MQYGASLLNTNSRQLVKRICEGPKSRHDYLRQLILRDDASDYLGKLLGHSDPEIRLATVKRIPKRLVKTVAKQLHRTLKDTDSRVRSESIKCLSKIDTSAQLKTLLAALGDEENAVQISAIRVLAKTGNPGATKDIAKCLSNSEQNVRIAAAEALMNLTGSGVIPMLAKALNDPLPGVRLRILRVIAKHKITSLGKEVANAIHDPDLMVQEMAIRALGELAVEKSIPDLLAVLKISDNALLRIRAVEAMANYRDRDTSKALTSTLSDTDVNVRCAAADILTIRMEHSAIQALKQAIKKEHDSTAQRHMEICLSGIVNRKTPRTAPTKDLLSGTWYSSPSLDAGSLIYTFRSDGTGEFEDFMMGVTRNSAKFKYIKKQGHFIIFTDAKRRKIKTRFRISHSQHFEPSEGSFPCLKLVFEREPFFHGLKPGKSTYYQVDR